jgi:hypothetical protein
MKITINQLRRIIKEEVSRAMDEAPRKLPGSLPGEVPDVEGLKLTMKDTYGRARAFKPVPGNPNVVLVKDMEIPGQFWPWEYDPNYGGWNEGDGPVDAAGELI